MNDVLNWHKIIQNNAGGTPKPPSHLE